MEKFTHTAQMHPIDPALAFQLGNSAFNSRKLDEAISYYQLALKAAPQVVEVYNNLATALKENSDLNTAIQIARSGLLIRNDFPPLHNTLGSCLARTKNLRAAEWHYKKALELKPEFIEATINLAYIYNKSGHQAEARRILLSAVKDNPNNIELLVTLGMTLKNRAEKQKYLHMALKISPGHLQATSHLAMILTLSGRNLEALALYENLSALYPQRPEVAANLALLLNGLGRHDEAVKAFQKASVLDPKISTTLPYFIQSMMHQCMWKDLLVVSKQYIASLTKKIESGDPVPNPPFVFAAMEIPPSLQLSIARSYSNQFLTQTGVKSPTTPGPMPFDKVRKLRVGYISPDFKSHSVATCLLPLLAAHNRKEFEWFGYFAGGSESDSITIKFNKLFCHWRDLRGLGLTAARNTIKNDSLDLLIDLAGHTKNSALDVLATQPVPIQAHYLGYGCTIGSDCIQYLITDSTHTTNHIEKACHEHLVYLPNSFMATDSTQVPSKNLDRSTENLPKNAFVFVCFNNHYKLDPTIFANWMQILKATPKSILWLLGANSSVLNNLKEAAERSGVNSERLVFAKRVSRDMHLARIRLANLALDTRIHGGGVTTLDALGAGLPVITLAGTTHPSRLGASILTAAGVPELVTQSITEYKKLAIQLANNTKLLKKLQQKVICAQRWAPLFKTDLLARNLESSYMEMIRRSQQCQEPTNIYIQADDRNSS